MRAGCASQVVRPSIVGQDGGFKSRTRTSDNGWLRRSRTEVLDTVHRRFADALGLDDAIVRSGPLKKGRALESKGTKRGDVVETKREASAPALPCARC